MCENHDPRTIDRRTLLRVAGAAGIGASLVGVAAAPAFAANSQNGWSGITSSSDTRLDRSFKASGVAFPGGVRRGDVSTVLRYVASEFHRTVEPLVVGWCWGWADRDIRGKEVLSNHASATAIDVNAPAHPMGAENTFSSSQVTRIHQILDMCEGTVRWGGDYSGRKDEMHFEINVPPSSSALPRVAAKLLGAVVTGSQLAITAADASKVFYADGSGRMVNLWFSGGDSGWHGPSAIQGATGANGAVSAAKNGRNVFYTQSDGTIANSWFDGSKWNGPFTLPAEGNNPVVAPTARMSRVFFTKDDGSIANAWRGSDGAWRGEGRIPGKAAGPLASQGDGNRVFFTDEDGYIANSWFNSGSWHGSSRIGGKGTYPAASENSVNPTVFYISAGGVLKVVKWEHGVWSDPVTIPGNPVGPLDVSADGSHVVYAEADGQIRNTWRGGSGAWHANDLPGKGSNPVIADNERRVVFIGEDGRIYNTWRSAATDGNWAGPSRISHLD